MRRFEGPAMPLMTSVARLLISKSRTVPCCNREISRPFAISAGSTRNSPSEQELKAARAWLSDLTPDTIPNSIADVTFSRSSGPGGQNVNKVNSKATLKVPLAELLRHVPALLHPEIRASRFCKNGSDAIVIQADEYRKQSDNANSCFQKLHNVIVEAGSRAVPGETSGAQKERVKGLQKAANEQRLKGKRATSMKKSARQGGGKGAQEW